MTADPSREYLELQEDWPEASHEQLADGAKLLQEMAEETLSNLQIGNEIDWDKVALVAAKLKDMMTK